MKITIVAGARPNFMKIAPITRAIEAARALGKSISYRLVYTGRKDDTSLDASLFSDLDMKAPDVYLGVESSNPTSLTAGIMVAFEQELTENPAHVVLVVDDLTATMSCAIVAKKQGIKVAHLVAGTRSFDMKMPKEVNRMITDGLSFESSCITWTFWESVTPLIWTGPFPLSRSCFISVYSARSTSGFAKTSAMVPPVFC